MRSRTRILLPLGLAAAAALPVGQMLAGCIVDWADDCARSASGAAGCLVPSSSSSSGSSNSSGGAGPTTTSSSSASGSMPDSGGGTGGAAECTTVNDCQVPQGPCMAFGTPACVKGVCTVTYVHGNPPVQPYGTCTQNECDDAGVFNAGLPDSNNVFDDNNPCTKDQCTGTTPQHVKQPGISCPLGTGMGVCELSPDLSSNAIFCAQCDPTIATSCNGIGPPGAMCLAGKCVPPSCTDGLLDNDETDKDCGGSKCLPCAAGQHCASYQDCFSQVCQGVDGGPLVCIAPTCSDMTQNGSETDKDCGGGSCPKCAANLRCAAPTDCMSGVCKPNDQGVNTCQAPNCMDGVQNGSETGVDCGGDIDAGTGCPPCVSP